MFRTFKCSECQAITTATRAELASRFRMRCSGCGSISLDRVSNRKAPTPDDELEPVGGRNGEMLFGFGKYKGKRLREVPIGYVEWLADYDIQKAGGALAHAIICARIFLNGTHKPVKAASKPVNAKKCMACNKNLAKKGKAHCTPCLKLKFR